MQSLEMIVSIPSASILSVTCGVEFIDLIPRPQLNTLQEEWGDSSVFQHGEVSHVVKA